MADDWQPGDLALCIHDKQWAPNGGEREPDECSVIKSALFPRVGSEWRVVAVEVHERCEGSVVYLMIAGQPSDIVFDARCFTKIGEHEADEFDREVIELMNGKPARLPA